MKPFSELTAKRRRFADEYLIDLNATQAALRAGFSKNTASRHGASLLKDETIAAYIRDRQSMREFRTEITQDRVLQELAKIGFADLKDYLSYRTEKAIVGADEDGEPIYGYQDVIELKPSTAVDGAVVAEIKHTREGIAFKLHDKVAALEKMGRHLGMFKDKVEVTGEAGGPMQVVFSPLMKPPDSASE